MSVSRHLNVHQRSVLENHAHTRGRPPASQQPTSVPMTQPEAYNYDHVQVDRRNGANLVSYRVFCTPVQHSSIQSARTPIRLLFYLLKRGCAMLDNSRVSWTHPQWVILWNFSYAQGRALRVQPESTGNLRILSFNRSKSAALNGFEMLQSSWENRKTRRTPILKPSYFSCHRNYKSHRQQVKEYIERNGLWENEKNGRMQKNVGRRRRQSSEIPFFNSRLSSNMYIQLSLCLIMWTSSYIVKLFPTCREVAREKS